MIGFGLEFALMLKYLPVPHNSNARTTTISTNLFSRWIPVLLWAGVIFYLSSQPAIKASENHLLDFLIKKSAHVIEYALLFFLIARAQHYRRHQLTFLLTLSYAFLDETHQLFVPGRTGTIRDVFLFDLLGMTLAWLFIPARK